MTLVLFVAEALAVASCSSCSEPQRPGARSSDNAQEGNFAEERRISEAATAPGSDPEASARLSADAGDFRFIGYSMLTPGILPAAYGVVCRPAIETQGDQLVRALRADSDVPPRSEEGAKYLTLRSDRHRVFGRRYNVSLLQNPRNPYRDFCRAASEGQERVIDPPVLEPKDYGYRDLEPTEHPVDLGEAARRGTEAALDRAIAANRSHLDEADPLRMTPMAWAIAYDREREAETLLRAGAHATGVTPRSLTSTSPIQIARAKQMRRLIDLMLPQLGTATKRRLWDDPGLVMSNRPAVNEAIEQVRRKFPESLSREDGYQAILAIDEVGSVTGCRIEPATGLGELDRRLCDTLRKKAHWRPARDVYGERAPGEVSMRLRLSNQP